MKPDAEDFLTQEQADRDLERSDSPLTHLDIRPQQACKDCGYIAREVEPGRWICPCSEWGAAA